MYFSWARWTVLPTGLCYIVEMTRTMNNSMNFYGAAADHIERKIGFYDKHTVSIARKLFMFGDPAEARIGREGVDSFVELFRESDGPRWAVSGNPIIDRKHVVFRNRKVAYRVLIWHGRADTVFASSVNG